ncbi:hypothetical protein INT48_008209 [Thamnidium elegans]|uniref:GATA-type domain-containing protein n=1 Tax=Thamnidium elegans TaxID=101142 RepID=A0A8H7SWX4_9FUNG|nr:hypothetical protein INT48_008209 [Thamnidium elegans]
MSSSALIAAKKRLETSLKKYEIPTVEKCDRQDTCDSGVLLLSLLQSRLHWTNSVFTKYRADPTQQPKRANNSRKKWPNMKYLGTGTLELGPHLFPNTSFYEASRAIPWTTIAKQLNIKIPDQDTAMENVEQDPSQLLQFVDIVFELNELPNERFIFPKDALISLSVEDGPIVLHASFVLPIDSTDGFFEKPKDQISKWGKSCVLPYIRDFTTMVDPRPEDTKVYQPANIRISHLNQTTIDALEDNVHKPDQVHQSMTLQQNTFPKPRFVKYDLSQDPIHHAEVQDLVKRALTVPDITTGPIMAEKKRNEILNAIRLGKRPRDEKFEAELPKNKYTNTVAKEDGLLKCAYCSTKYTCMWRPGPAGHGTLCNSCGIQWKRGQILKDAPVIRPEEEKRLIKERKERERMLEIVELERETKRVQKKMERETDIPSKKPVLPVPKQRQTKSATNIPNENPSETLLEDNKKKAKAKIVDKMNKPDLAEPVHIQPIEPAPAVLQPAPQQQVQPILPAQPQVQPQQTQQQQTNSFFLYSQGGIPLPTLSIDFGGITIFSHPNCAVTLLDGHFHVRLCTEPGEQSLINLEKTDLTDAQFTISQEGDANNKREILIMTIPALKKSIQILDQTLAPTITIRFLEKLDPSGGAVVKRILQRWLVTVPQS